MVGEHNSYFIIVCKYKRKHAIQIQFKFNSNSVGPTKSHIKVLF